MISAGRFINLLRLFFGFGICVCISGCPSTKNSPPTKTVTGEMPDNTLGAGDVFDVRVYGEEELSKTFRVASDGSIDFPLLGTVTVNGMTPTEVSHLLEDGLRSLKFRFS